MNQQQPTIMLTGTRTGVENTTTSTTFGELVGTPGEVIITSQVSTITALFVGECHASAGQHVEVRIMVDSEVAHPGPVTLTSETSYGSRSYLAILSNVPAGNHDVTLHWRVTGGTGYMRSRSFTVWELV